MCDCISTTTEMVLQSLKEKGAAQKRPIVVGDKATMLGTGIQRVENTLVLVTANEVAYERQETKADGTLGKVRKATMTVVHSYCPFCGIKK